MGMPFDNWHEGTATRSRTDFDLVEWLSLTNDANGPPGGERPNSGSWLQLRRRTRGAGWN